MGPLIDRTGNINTDHENEEPAVYFIFKRSDGYVGQINRESRFIAERELASVPRLSFEIVHEADDWDDDFITRLEDLRAASNYVKPSVR